jgi:peptidoglycan-N-acetylglucosamine deacetylase
VEGHLTTTPQTQLMKGNTELGSRRRWRRLWASALFVAALAGFAVPELLHLLRVRTYDDSFLPACRVETAERVVALTFDDGPDPRYTRRLLDVLLQCGARATFFVLGAHAVHHMDLVELERRSGMEIGSHTFTHPHLPELDPSAALAEVEKAAQAIRLAGIESNLYRAPYGELSADHLTAIGGSGLTPVHWSLAIDHYVGGLGLSPKAATDQILRDVRPGDIILAHDAAILPKDGGGSRRAAMETLTLVLAGLRSNGWTVTSYSDLLASGSVMRAKPRWWFWQTGFDCPNRS